jgi:hypothetical protein
LSSDPNPAVFGDISGAMFLTNVALIEKVCVEGLLLGIEGFFANSLNKKFQTGYLIFILCRYIWKTDF